MKERFFLFVQKTLSLLSKNLMRGFFKNHHMVIRSGILTYTETALY